MAALIKTYNIRGKDFIRAGEASIQIKNLLKSLRLDQKIIRRVAICGYEGEMNVVMHGGNGLLTLTIDEDRITLEITDNGAGIADIEKAMQAGFSTAADEYREMGFGAGMGLPNMQKNADRFHIESTLGQGTRVVMTYHLKAQDLK